MVKMVKKVETVKFKNYTRKIKSPFMIYLGFESISVPGNNGKQNPDESYTNKYQNHVGCSFGYKIVCVDDQFSKVYKLYLGQDAAHKFCTNVIELQSRDEKEVINNKELLITKEVDETFESSTKC